MRMINVHAAKTSLSSLLEDVQRGEEIVIAKAGKPVAKLVAFEPRTERRQLGLLKGKAWAAPDAWEPDPELERLFYEDSPEMPAELDDELDGPTEPNGNVGR